MRTSEAKSKKPSPKSLVAKGTLAAALTLVLTGAFVAITVVITGCGSGSQDALKNYDTLAKNSAATRSENIIQTPVHHTGSFTIENQDTLDFYQGQDKTVYFNVRLFFDDNSSVKYDVTMTKGPSDLGANLKRVGPNSFALHWSPATTTLTPTETNRVIDLQLSVVVQSVGTNTANSTGIQYQRDLKIELYKEQDPPIIENSEASPIKLVPGAEVNADQDVKVQFVAAAKGLHSADDLQIKFDRGPSEPTVTSNQMDGYASIDGLKCAPISGAAGVDSQGRSRSQCEVTFHAAQFVLLFQKKIETSAALSAAFQKGTLTSGQALFFITASNAYNQKASTSHEIVINVDFNDKAGEPQFVDNNTAAITGKIGAPTAQQFFIRADSARGNLNIKSIKFEDQSSATNVSKKGSTTYAKISENGVNVTLTCQSSAGAIGDAMGCKIGNCVKSCQVQLSSTCDAVEGTNNLIIGADSVLGSSVQDKDLSFKVTLKDKAASCNKVHSPSTQAATTQAEGKKP